jgi:hypothetical protein
MSLAILLLRLFKSISLEGATMVFIGTVFAVSSHVFPWYTTALLPWVAVLVSPLWTHQGLSAKGLAVAMGWYFPCVSLFGYFFNNTRDWHVYYQFVYAVVMAGLGVALIVGVWGQLRRLYKLTLEGGSAKHN